MTFPTVFPLKRNGIKCSDLTLSTPFMAHRFMEKFCINQRERIEVVYAQVTTEHSTIFKSKLPNVIEKNIDSHEKGYTILIVVLGVLMDLIYDNSCFDHCFESNPSL